MCRRHPIFTSMLTLPEKDPIQHEATLHWMVFYPTLRWILFSAILFGLMLFFNLDFLLQTRFHAPSWILWPVGAAALGLIFSSLITQSIVILTTRIYLTSHKLFLRTGWFNVQQMELPLKQIESTSVQQDFWGKCFDYGMVTFYGTGGRQPRAFWVISPALFTERLSQLQDAQD